MKIIDVLAEHKMKMSPQLQPIMAKALKEVFPHGFESCELNHWDEAKIIWHLCSIDLPEEDIGQVILLTARYSKIWAFS
jgi:hypothetical protein